MRDTSYYLFMFAVIVTFCGHLGNCGHQVKKPSTPDEFSTKQTSYVFPSRQEQSSNSECCPCYACCACPRRNGPLNHEQRDLSDQTPLGERLDDDFEDIDPINRWRGHRAGQTPQSQQPPLFHRKLIPSIGVLVLQLDDPYSGLRTRQTFSQLSALRPLLARLNPLLSYSSKEPTKNQTTASKSKAGTRTPIEVADIINVH